MIYYIADTHFGHENIIELCHRPFSSAEEMERQLIKAWNERVTSRDMVIVLGDLFYRHKDPERVLTQLRGRKKLIVGNHDSNWMCRVDASRYFQSITNMTEASDQGVSMTLCHYPLMAWHHPVRAYMVHGHIHNDRKASYWPWLKAEDHALNAGVDINGFKPVTFEEMLENNRRFKALE